MLCFFFYDVPSSFCRCFRRTVPVIRMPSTRRNVLLVGLFLVATTFVLPTAASSGVRRNLAEAEDDLNAEFLKMNPTASPTLPTERPNAWLFGDRGLSCDEACMPFGGACNVAAQNAIDTAEKFRFVVETQLGYPAGGQYQGDNPSTLNPVFFRQPTTNGFYYFNPAGLPVPAEGLCAAIPSFTDRRICCCGTTADCPVA
jgi:hypothetical protein